MKRNGRNTPRKPFPLILLSKSAGSEAAPFPAMNRDFIIGFGVEWPREVPIRLSGSKGEVVSDRIKFDGKIDIFNVAAIRHLNLHGSEIQDPVDTRQDELICNTLGFICRCGDDAHVNFPFLHHFFKFIHMVDQQAVRQSSADLLRVDIERGCKHVAVLDEVPVPDQSRPEISKADHGKIPRAVQTQDLLDLVDQFVDSIPDSSYSELPKIGEVFSNLSRIHAALFCKAL